MQPNRVPVSQQLLIAGAVLTVIAVVALIGVWVTRDDTPQQGTLGEPTATATATAATTTTPVDPVRVFPVIGEVSYGHTHHGYPATDILTSCGLPYVAPISGVVLEVNRKDSYDPKVNAGPTRGGLSVSLLGDDGVRYYGSHFSAIEPGIEPGVRVAAGDRVATVGRTGDASACHVHFGLSPPCARTGDWFNRRGLIWPWPYLDSWRSGGNMSPVGEINQYVADKGCPDHPLVEA